MNKSRKSRAEKASRNKGRAFSVTFHGLLLIVMFLPFFSMKPPEEPTKEALVIQFDYPYNQYVKPEKFVEELESTDMASKMSGSEAGGSEVSEEQPKQSRPQQAAPSKIASPSVSAVSNPTMSSALRTNIGEIPLPTPKVVTKQAWDKAGGSDFYEVDGLEEMKMIDWSDGGFGDIAGSGTGDGDDDSDISSEGFGTGSSGQGGQGGGTGSTNGTGSGPGGGTGAGNAGNKTGVGQNGNGLSWGVGVDEGFLSRPLIQRADVASLAVKEGKVTIHICVDRSGMVLSSKYDVANSTLKDPAFIAKAEKCAASYIFARDDEAPERQCGKLAFIFKIK